MYSFNRVLLLCPIKWSESMQYSHSLSWSSFLIFRKGGGGWGTCGYTSQVKEGWIWGYKSDTVHIRIISAFSKQKQKEHKFKVSLDYIVKIYFKQSKTKRVTDNATGGRYYKYGIGGCHLLLLMCSWFYSQIKYMNMHQKNTNSLPRWHKHLIPP